jgi:predicted nucleotidyltransferase component of viral defense system
MKLKSDIKRISIEKNISPQQVLQNYVLERFLERMSISKYNKNFILKGGLLISSLIGIGSRTTMDMDTTICHFPVNEESIRRILEDICKIDLNDNFVFKFINIQEIRENDTYKGYRVTLNADFNPLSVILKIDITTGDIIVPSAIKYEYKLLLEDRKINVMSYSIYTILAEKIESIISRSVLNTRPRDFYDVNILSINYKDKMDYNLLKKAIIKTFEHRDSINKLNNYHNVIDEIKKSKTMNDFWNKYVSNYDYANGYSFIEVCSNLEILLNKALKY